MVWVAWRKRQNQREAEDAARAKEAAERTKQEELKKRLLEIKRDLIELEKLLEQWLQSMWERGEAFPASRISEIDERFYKLPSDAAFLSGRYESELGEVLDCIRLTWNHLADLQDVLPISPGGDGHSIRWRASFRKAEGESKDEGRLARRVALQSAGSLWVAMRKRRINFTDRLFKDSDTSSADIVRVRVSAEAGTVRSRVGRVDPEVELQRRRADELQAEEEIAAEVAKKSLQALLKIEEKGDA